MFFLRLLGYFWDFWSYFKIFGQILRFLIKITWFLSFSGKNDAESLWNFVKNLILNPKHAKLDQKSRFGHVRTCKVVIWTCPDLPSRDLDMSGPVQEDKYLLQNNGNTFFFWDFTPFHFLWPVLTSKQRKYFFFWDFTPFHFLWPVLTSKQRKYFYFFRLYTFPFFISKIIIF